MSLIKITQADKWFSLCVRERAEWSCESCQKHYQQGDQGLDCAHIYSRRHKSTRHHSDNAVALCVGCHRRYSGNPLDFAKWVETKLGTARLEMLWERREAAIKYNKALDKEISSHYKAEFARMKSLRADGVMGRIEFVSFW
jgi:hypothetical protein